jgi:hypothetical protein
MTPCMPVNFQRTIRRYIPEDSTLHNHRCETFKSYILVFIYLFIYLCLFNDAISSSDYIESNDMMINEY